MKIYDRIKNLCQENGITITKLEEQCGLSQNSVKKWDTRNSLPSGESAVKIAKHFNVTTDYLLGLTDVAAQTTNSQIMPDGWDRLTPEQRQDIMNLVEYHANSYIQANETAKWVDKKTSAKK